jgi:tetratricopeptide (TPR) repeat protein
MIQQLPDPSPESVRIVGYALTYWADFVTQLNNSPNQEFLDEHNNILRAVKMGLGAAETRRPALQLALDAFFVVESGGLWPAWIPMFEAVYGRFCDVDRTLHARFLGRLGQLYRLHSRLDEALAIHQDAAALIAPLPADSLIACEIAFQLAEDHRRKFQYEQAKQYGQAAWEAAETAQQSDAWRAAVANSLGLIYEGSGKLEEAADWYTISLGLWRPLQRPVESGRALSNLGNVLQRQGKLDEALLTYHQALRQLEGASLWLEKLIVQYNIAVVYFYQEEYGAAEAILTDAHLTMGRQPEMHLVLYASICHSLGNVIVKQGRFAEAEAPLRQSAAAWQKLGDDLSLANCLGVLAEALTGQGQVDEACQLYRQAIGLAANRRDIPWGEKLYQEFSAAYAALSDGAELIPQ